MSDAAAFPRPSTDDPRWPRAAHWLAGSADQSAGAALAVLGVPAWRTSLSPTGARATPQAVRAALLRYSTYSTTHDVDVATLAAVDVGDLPDPDLDEDATSDAAADAVRRAHLLVALGGDNSVTFAVARGALGPDVRRAGLVVLDAHHDLRDGVSNGSPIRRLVQDAGLDPTHVVQVGIADFANSAEYGRLARDWGIRVMSREVVARRGIAACMRDALDIAGRSGGPVYVGLDVDVCDRAVAPACPASVPGGLSARELRVAAHLAGLHAQVRAIDITEVDAAADPPDGRTVRLAALCLLEAAAGLAARLAALSAEAGRGE